MSVIKKNKCINDHFTFTYVTLDKIYKMLFNMNGKKSTGYDGIPPKMVKLGAYELCIPVTYLVNQCIRTSSFPEYLKFAEITPIYKKDDMLNKANFHVCQRYLKVLLNSYACILKQNSHPICQDSGKNLVVNQFF